MLSKTLEPVMLSADFPRGISCGVHLYHDPMRGCSDQRLGMLRLNALTMAQADEQRTVRTKSQTAMTNLPSYAVGHCHFGIHAELLNSYCSSSSRRSIAELLHSDFRACFECDRDDVALHLGKYSFI